MFVIFHCIFFCSDIMNVIRINGYFNKIHFKKYMLYYLYNFPIFS